MWAMLKPTESREAGNQFTTHLVSGRTMRLSTKLLTCCATTSARKDNLLERLVSPSPPAATADQNINLHLQATCGKRMESMYHAKRTAQTLSAGAM
jgi:hypothetical protein